MCPLIYVLKGQREDLNLDCLSPRDKSGTEVEMIFSEGETDSPFVLCGPNSPRYEPANLTVA